MLYDGWKIIVGLIIGIGLLSYPFWPTAGKLGAKTPEPELTAKAKEAKECVEPKSYIKTEHMKLLDEWRQDAVRDANRIYYRVRNDKLLDLIGTMRDVLCRTNLDDVPPPDDSQSPE